MTDTWRETGIPGVRRRSLSVGADGRGSFAEIWRDTWTLGLEMRQANLSRSQPGVLRGLHVHRRQSDLWVVLDGHAFVAVVDIRGPLAGGGAPQVETLEAGPGEVILLPEGVAHGFYARDAVALLYLVTNEYDGSDELGFAWNDPGVGIDWPDPAPIVSDRDATAPSLANLLSRLGGMDQQSASR